MTTPSNRPRVLLTDRTTIETDWTCGMRRWWYKEEGGVGIVPSAPQAALEIGADIHAVLHRLGIEPDPNDVWRVMLEEPDPGDDVARELFARRFGWAYLWATQVEPVIRSEWETVTAEIEFVLERDPLWVATTPDRLLLRRADGAMRYNEYKSTSAAPGYAMTKWASYWPHAIQLHLGLQAIAEAFPAAPDVSAQVIGLAKGYEKDGKLRHPFTYAYVGKDGVAVRDYAYGRTLVPTWELPGGTLRWMESIATPALAAEVFPRSYVVRRDPRLIAQLVEQRTQRERTVAAVREACQVDLVARATYFPHNFNACRPAYGFACPYLSACHNASVADNPLASGEFIVRTPHHDLERLKQEDTHG